MKKNSVLSINILLAATFSATLCVSSFAPTLQRRSRQSGSSGIALFLRRTLSPQKQQTGCLQVTVNGGDETAKATHPSETSTTAEWWKTHEFQHADLAEKVRSDFEILSMTLPEINKPLVYLDSGATSQKPNQVLKALDYYYHNQNSNVHRGAHTLSREATGAYEGARDKVAKLVNAYSRNEIVFTSGATESINMVVQSYARTNLHPGDEILLTEMEHHANLVPWQMLAEQVPGIQLKFVPMDRSTGGVDLAKFEEMLNEKTKFVGFQHVSNVAGCINPVIDMVQMVRKKASADAKILVDACQSVPHMPVDVQDLGVDFLAASGHKMCGPTGIGILWGREDILNSMPPFMGGGEMIDQVTLEGSTFVPAPGRFEAGTPAIAQAIGMGAAVDYLQEIAGGMEKIEQYEHELAEYLYRRMSEVEGVSIIGPPSGVTRAAICAFVVDGVHPSDLSSFLDMEGIAVRAGHHCCQPLHQSLGYSHSARASLYFYNTKQDVDTFIEKLQNTISFFHNLEGKEGAALDDDFQPFI